MVTGQAPEQTDTSTDFVLDDQLPSGQTLTEDDPVRLAQRQKQIDYGKNTLGYVNYIKAVPREQRRVYKRGLLPVDPVTPDVRQVCSKRGFDGQVKKWRRMLHKYDPTAAPGYEPISLPEPVAARLPPQPEGDACPGAGDKRRCCAAAAADATDGGKRARRAVKAEDAAGEEEEAAARDIYGTWDEDDVAI